MMTQLKGSILLGTISLCVIAFLVGNVWADDCRTFCGVLEPTTALQANKSCDAVGQTLSFPLTINWNDGSYSTFSVNAVIQLVVGSCCDNLISSWFGTGVVTDGRFSGEKVITTCRTYSFSDDRMTCNGCQSSAGLSRVLIEHLFSFGTKGVGNWLECSGNGTLLFYPSVTTTPQDIYQTYYAVYKCNSCVESC